MKTSLAVLGLILTACVEAGGGYTSDTGTTGSRVKGTVAGITNGASTGSGTTAAATAGSSGNSQTSSSASSTGGGSCPSDQAACPPSGSIPLTSCPDGMIEVAGNAADYCTQEPVWCPISASDIFDPSLTADGDGCGYFYFCVAPSTEIHLTIAASSYLTLDFANMAPPVSTELYSDPGIPMVCNGIYQALDLPGFQPTLPSLLLNVYPLAGKGGPSACSNPAGWTFVLEDLDGGPVAASVAYQSGLAFDSTATQTSTNGFVLFYNIDQNVHTVQLAGSNPAFVLSDGGTLCPNIPSTPPFYLTGTVQVEVGKVSYMPYLLGAP